MSACIYQQAKSTMQSGKARVGDWLLEHEPADAQRPDPLTGWAGSRDTARQVKLSFATLAAAKAYADQHGIAYHVVADGTRSLKLQAYADNFQVGPITPA